MNNIIDNVEIPFDTTWNNIGIGLIETGNFYSVPLQIRNNNTKSTKSTKCEDNIYKEDGTYTEEAIDSTYSGTELLDLENFIYYAQNANIPCNTSYLNKETLINDFLVPV